MNYLKLDQKITANFFQNTCFFALAFLIVFHTEDAFAGTDGDEFSDMYNWITGLATGTFGRIVATISLLGAVFIMASTQSLKSAAIPLSVSGILFYGPDILASVVAATI